MEVSCCVRRTAEVDLERARMFCAPASLTTTFLAISLHASHVS